MCGLIPTLLILLEFVYTADGLYDLDIIEANWNISTPDIIDVNLKVVQPTRGTFGVSGYIDIKQDINTDTTLGQVKVYYSSNGISYQLTPFRVPENTLTYNMNAAYKHYLMERIKECCENTLEFDVFVSPLTKHLITCENCLFPSDNIPPTLRLGYYRLVIMLYNDLVMNITLLLKLALA